MLQVEDEVDLRLKRRGLFDEGMLVPDVLARSRKPAQAQPLHFAGLFDLLRGEFRAPEIGGLGRVWTCLVQPSVSHRPPGRRRVDDDPLLLDAELSLDAQKLGRLPNQRHGVAPICLNEGASDFRWADRFVRPPILKQFQEDDLRFFDVGHRQKLPRSDGFVCSAGGW